MIIPTLDNQYSDFQYGCEYDSHLPPANSQYMRISLELFYVESGKVLLENPFYNQNERFPLIFIELFQHFLER